MAHGVKVIEEYREKVVNGPIGRTLLWLGLPLMVVQVVHVSYNVADAYWLSRYSKVAYATPRQIWPLFMFINAIVQGLGAANMAFISQAIGARDYDYAKKVVSFFITTMLTLNTVTVTAFVLLGPYVYRHVMATPPEIYDYVVMYSSIISLDLFLSGLYLCYSTIFQAMGDTRTPSRAGIVSSLTNIILDPLFIFGVRYGDIVLVPEMGVAGAAWATVLSRFIGFLIVMRVLFKKYPFLNVRPTFSVEKDWLIKSTRIGAPVALMMMSNSLAFMFQNRLINSFGAYVTAAAAIGFVLMDLADAALWGFTSSVATMIGQALGARLEERARKVAKTAMLYIGICTFVGSTIILVFRKAFIGFFTDVPEIMREADLFVQYFAPTLAFFAVFFIGMSIGRGSGHTLYPTIIGIVRLWGLRIGLGYLLAFVLEVGTLGLWVSMAFSNFAGGLAIVPWALWGNWTRPIIRKRALT